MDRWRLLLTGHNDPYTNMAIDEAILKVYADRNIPPTLRIYGWQPKGFSLGYFQDAFKLLNIDKCICQNIPFVRRITGGGLIFHNQELTYSISCSKEDIKSFGSVKEGFRRLTLFLINFYRSLGLDVYFFYERKDKSFKRKPTSFCFDSNEDCDIIIEGKKIGGNAQRRIKNVIFQHGSIPLRLDLDKIQVFLNERLVDIDKKVISLKEALGRSIDFKEASFLLRESFKKTFFVNLIEGEFTSREEILIQVLLEHKYKTREWNLYRIYSENASCT